MKRVNLTCDSCSTETEDVYLGFYERSIEIISPDTISIEAYCPRCYEETGIELIASSKF